MDIISIDDISTIFPRGLVDGEDTRAEALIEQSLELIGLEFARRHRNFERELETTSWLKSAAKQAVRVMVGQAIHIGEMVGQAGGSSTTGPQSDSVTWSQGISIHWGGVGVDHSILELLGLSGGVVPIGQGGRVIPYGWRDWRRP